MADFAARIAAASGNPEALLALCVELAQEVSRLAAEAAVLEGRRAKDRQRKKNPPQKSTDVLGVHRNGAETPPPQVSSSFPEPHITPSFPPTPHPLPASPEEVRLVERAPECRAVVVRFLDGKDSTARAAWIGRFHGALDRPPHPTGQELTDALEDLMTEPRDKWVPPLFRRYVERIRRDATRAAERESAPASNNNAAAEAFAKIRELTREVMTPGNGTRRFIPQSEVEKLGQRVANAYRAIGGADRVLGAKPETLGFVIHDFEKAYAQTKAMA